MRAKNRTGYLAPLAYVFALTPLLLAVLFVVLVTNNMGMTAGAGIVDTLLVFGLPVCFIAWLVVTVICFVKKDKRAGFISLLAILFFAAFPVGIMIFYPKCDDCSEISCSC